VEEVLKPDRALVVGTIVLMFLLQIKLGYTIPPPPVTHPNFVEVTGPHGVTVLIGPLEASPTGGYEREIILPGQPPFMVSTEPGITPQEIANIYG
jgi:hypothetical protein